MSRRMKLRFIHIPKCGGKYVESVFSPWIASCDTLSDWAAGHLTFQEYRTAFETQGIRFTDAFTFAVVRNPWDWHVSWYHYFKSDPEGSDSGHRIEGQMFQRLS